MINRKRNKIAEDCDQHVILSKNRAFHTVILFILLMTMLVGLVSACGQASRPTTAKGWLDLGEKYLLDLQYEQAVVAFNKAIEIEPNNVPARIGIAKAYIGLDKPDEAQSVLLEALDIDPGNKEAIDMLESLPEEQDKITKPSTSTATLPSETAATEPQSKSLTDAEVAALIEQRIGKFEWYDFEINPLLFKSESQGYHYLQGGFGFGHGIVSIEPIALKNDQRVYLAIAIQDYPTHYLQGLYYFSDYRDTGFELFSFNNRGALMNLTAYLFREHDGNLIEIEQMRLVNAIDSTDGSSLISIYEYEGQIWLAVSNIRYPYDTILNMFINMRITDSGFTDKYNIILYEINDLAEFQQADFESWSAKHDYYPTHLLSYHSRYDDGYNDYLNKFSEYLSKQPLGFEESGDRDSKSSLGWFALPGIDVQTICEIKYPDVPYYNFSVNSADYREEITNYAQFGY